MIRTNLFGACGELARGLPAVKWMRKVENFHVTLRFLGNVVETRVNELEPALTRALASLPPFEIDVRGLGAFPAPQQADVLWAGIDDPTAGLARIAEVVAALTRPFDATGGKASGPKETRPFRAHVTIGRAKPAVDVRGAVATMAQRPFGRFTVDEVHVYESRLRPEGSTYVLVSRAPLAR